MSKKLIFRILIGVAVLFAMIFGSKIFETNQKGYYQIKQAAISGTMSARMTPGMYLQWFGDIQTWPKAATFFFTKDSDEGASRDESIEVRFNDGSLCDISGTLRVLMPSSEKHVIDLVTSSGYRSYEDLEARLILPVVRKALRSSATLMNARESYSEKRSNFISWAWEQIENGEFVTKEIVKKVKDPVSGELVTKTFNIIERDENGKPLYKKNPLEGTGIRLNNFEVKVFAYSDKVQKQIATQQESLMEVETAKAQSKKAEQEKLKIEAEGKAAVAKAQYEEEQKKIKAVVEAEKEKEVAELKALKEYEVSKLEKKAAGEIKQKEILLGQGEAARKRAVMLADGALKQKLDAYVQVMSKFAEEFGKQKWTPETMIVSGGGKNTPTGGAVDNFMSLLTVKAAKDLGLDIRMRGKGAIPSQDE